MSKNDSPLSNQLDLFFEMLLSTASATPESSSSNRQIVNLEDALTVALPSDDSDWSEEDEFFDALENIPESSSADLKIESAVHEKDEETPHVKPRVELPKKACGSFELICWIAGQDEIMKKLSPENRKKVEDVVGTMRDPAPYQIAMPMFNDFAKRNKAMVKELDPKLQEDILRKLWIHYGH